MKNVEFISAGAGSGKTYTIVNKIVDFIRDGICRADQIILTTFTRAAASELLEKARAALYKEGLFDEALNLESAAIGTIHSISYEIVSRYWYILGLSPDLRLIADESRDFYVRQSLATLPNEEQLRLFRKVRRKFDIRVKGKYGNDTKDPDFYFWKKDLEDLIDKINNFCLTDEDIEASACNSIEWLKEVLGVKETDHYIPLAAQLLEMAQRIHDGADNITDKRIIENIPEHKKNIESLNEEYSSKLEIRGWDTIDFYAFAKEINNYIGKKAYEKIFPEEVAIFAELPDRVMALNSSYSLAKDYISTIVALAKKWKEEYKEFKKSRRLLDFNDIQDYFSSLLEKPQVIDEIKSRYKVALVDEFQDCSPQQVLFFRRLSHLMKQNVWVGDVKQAIYNFRGTDISVVQEILNKAKTKEDGNKLSSLDKCWRSNSSIVNLANSIFTKTFEGRLDKELVVLGMPGAETKYNRPAERELQHWHFEFSGKEQRHLALASHLKAIIEKGEFPCSYDDIAILCRKGGEIDDYARAFTSLGIPYRIKKTNDKSTKNSNPIILFLNALLAYAANERNTLSKGMIAYLCEPGWNISEILSSRLTSVLNESSKEEDKKIKWLENIKILDKIDSLRNILSNQSVAWAVDTLVNQLNVTDILKIIDSNIDPDKICNDLVAKAEEYEDICSNLSLGCSFSGFVEYLKTHPVNLSGNSNGVLLTTYHASKGLEWKCVILSELNNNVIDLTKIISGINVYRKKGIARFNMLPEFISSLFTKTIQTRIETTDVYNILKENTFEEAKRLLYVGMTRPKELLITLTGTSRTVSESGRRNTTNYATKWPDLVTNMPINAIGFSGEYLEWGGNKFKYTVIEYQPDTMDREKEKWISDVLKGVEKNLVFSPRFLSPSRLPKSENLKQVEIAGDFADRLNVKARKGEDAAIGDCIHQLLCVFQDNSPFQNKIPKITSEFGVILSADSFMNSARSMYEWLQASYGPPVEIIREIPFQLKTKDGHEIHGEIDLIYRTNEGDVLIDYKTYSGKISDVFDPESKFFAGKYSGQLEAYEEAIKRAGFKLRDSLICYFNLGKMIRFIYS